MTKWQHFLHSISGEVVHFDLKTLVRSANRRPRTTGRRKREHERSGNVRILRSSLPGRSRAGSRVSGRLVAIIIFTLCRVSNPSIWFRSWGRTQNGQGREQRRRSTPRTASDTHAAPHNSNMAKGLYWITFLIFYFWFYPFFSNLVANLQLPPKLLRSTAYTSSLAAPVRI